MATDDGARRGLNLQQQKKRAKELLRGARKGVPEATARFLGHLPRAGGMSAEALESAALSLSDAQLVIARENGFASWPKLKHHIEQQALESSEAEAALIRAAVAGNEPAVEAALAAHDDLARRSIWAAAAVLDEHAVAGWLERDGSLAQARGGPHGWTPLLYACSGRPGAGGKDAARLSIVASLLEHGADPNDGTPETDSVRGYRTALGAAAGRARSAALVKALLAAGADPADGPTLWEGSAMWEAVRQRDVESLRYILEADPPHWLLCHALPLSLQQEDLDMVRLLLEHGASPNWNKTTWSFGGTSLHEAIVLGRGGSIIEALLDAGADPESRDRDGRTPWAVAVRVGHASAQQLLADRGASTTTSDVDRWIATCLRGDAEATPPASAELRRTDHQWLARAVRWDKPAAVPLLLAGGCDPSVPDDDGETALHLAASMGDRQLCEMLLDAGAPIDARNFAGETPLQSAVCGGAGSLVDFFLERGASAMLVRDLHGLREPVEKKLREAGAVERDLAEPFERAADAIAAGDLETLERLLADEPTLVHERSPRAHRATLLHYLGANGVEDERQKTPSNAVEIMECLLDAGADPNALSYTYRGGPDQTTAGLLVSSGHPAEAGLTLPLVRTLLRHGADLSPEWALLGQLAEARQNGDAFARQADPVVLGAALREAAKLGEPDLVRQLLGLDANVDDADAGGATALHWAALNGHTPVVDALLEAGADRTRVDDVHGGPPSGWARAGGHLELAKRLAR